MTAKISFPLQFCPTSQFLSLLSHSSLHTGSGNAYSLFHCLFTRGEKGRISFRFPISFIHSLHDKTHNTHDKLLQHSWQSLTAHNHFSCTSLSLCLPFGGHSAHTSALHFLLVFWLTCYGAKMQLCKSQLCFPFCISAHKPQTASFHQTVATQTLTHHLTVIPQANEAAHKPSKKRLSPHKASSASTNVPPAKETRFLLAIPEGSQALDHGLRIRDSSGGLLKVSTKGGFWAPDHVVLSPSSWPLVSMNRSPPKTM